MPFGSPPPQVPPSAPRTEVGPSEILAVGKLGKIAVPRGIVHLTFSLPPGPPCDDVRRQAWERWAADCFAPLLAPALLEMAALAHRERVAELKAADQALAQKLPLEITERLRTAGHGLLAELAGARSARWLPRFQVWTASGEAPGLFPTIFAARGALFHLPRRTLLAVYAQSEWCGAVGSIGVTPPSDALASLDDCILRPALVPVAA